MSDFPIVQRYSFLYSLLPLPVQEGVMYDCLRFPLLLFTPDSVTSIFYFTATPFLTVICVPSGALAVPEYPHLMIPFCA